MREALRALIIALLIAMAFITAIRATGGPSERPLLVAEQ